MPTRIFKKRPAHWPDEPAGRYPTPFGVLIISDKGTTTWEAQ